MQKRLIAIAAVAVAVLAGLVFSVINAQDNEFTYAGDTPMPAFPNDAEWVNVSEPLTLDDLAGKIVMLDFWTYGCINCIHVIPDLHQLEEEYSDYLVVIGVHSAKFDNEGNTTNIRNIVQRYGVTHPVVNDADFVIWSTYGVRAWPTIALIDPRGNVVGGRSGEGVYEAFQPILDVMVEEYGEAGLLDDTPLDKLAPEVLEREPTALNYPGKVLADTEGNRLIVSDTTHHRVVVTSLDNFDETVIIGTGEQGFADGSFNEAAFDSPQGLAISGDILFVADTGNHAIRQIDLAAGTVSTLVGTGEQANTYPPRAGTAPDVDLASPWDLTLHDGVLYVAMAGPHQLWRVDLETGLTEPHAGSGRENIVDGPLLQAQLAQPSGIDNDGETLYFADAEVSAIRTASIRTDGEVNTIVGTGLFDFGDVDGTGDEVLLQHALGVVVTPDGSLYIADTYNNKIKVIDPIERTSTTFAGDGTPGQLDGALDEARFYEPGGLDYADGKLYVADTNNHAIRIIDLETGTVSTVTFADEALLLGIEEETTLVDPLDDLGTTAEDNVIELEPQTVAPGAGEMVFRVMMPEGYKLNDQAPFTAINSSDDVVTIGVDYQSYREVEPKLPILLPVSFQEGETVFSTDLTIYWCEGVNQTLCFVDRWTLRVPVTVAADAEDNSVILPLELVPPNIGSDF